MLWQYHKSMKVEFSSHALDQLKVRSRISRFMVRATLLKPDEIGETFRGRQLFRKTYGNETLEVVAVKEDNVITVITQYFLEQ